MNKNDGVVKTSIGVDGHPIPIRFYARDDIFADVY
jgi:hypothetical protein